MILSEYNLSEENLIKIITDNASNMIRAFPAEVDENLESESNSDSEDLNFNEHYGLEEETDEFDDFEERNELAIFKYFLFIKF